MELASSLDALVDASRRSDDGDVPCSPEELREAVSIEPDVGDDENANGLGLRIQDGLELSRADSAPA